MSLNKETKSKSWFDYFYLGRSKRFAFFKAILHYIDKLDDFKMIINKVYGIKTNQK